MSEISHVSFLRVRYADTDQMGVVYYAKYFEYFEFARTELLRACGLPYRTIEEAGFHLPVIRACASYKKGAKYDDMLRIAATVPTEPNSKLEISYSVQLDVTGETIVTGETDLIFVAQKTGRPVRPPKLYCDAILHFIKTQRAE